MRVQCTTFLKIISIKGNLHWSRFLRFLVTAVDRCSMPGSHSSRRCLYAVPKSLNHHFTVSTAFIPGCNVQTYGNTPMSPALNLHDRPLCRSEERKPLFSALTLCGNASSFLQMTVSPAFISSIGGENFNASITTVWVLDFGAADDKALTPKNRTARNSVIGR